MKRINVLLVLFLVFAVISGCRKSGGSIAYIGGADGPSVVFVSPKNSSSVSMPTGPSVPSPQITPVPSDTGEEITIERITSSSDKDQDGLNDTDDILEGARKDVENKTAYKDGYYEGGYPPENEGVCTDVIWRAFKNAGYMLKDMIDEDIRNNLDLYPRVEGKPDPNIDFRRIKNLRVFFDRYATSLTTEIIPGDAENLKEWQAGDIVIFDDPAEHIGIISDKRNKDGVPLMIHNSWPCTQENDMLLDWRDNLSTIVGHYRFPPSDSEDGTE